VGRFFYNKFKGGVTLHFGLTNQV